MVEANNPVQAGKGKKLFAGLVVVAILIASIGIAVWYNSKINNHDALMNPLVNLEMTAQLSNYTAVVSVDPYIVNQGAQNVSAWINIEMLSYLINNFNNGTTNLQSILYNTSNPYNLGSGRVSDILNNNESDITFYDNDGNREITKNDTFIIKGQMAETLTDAISETGWCGIYIIFDDEYKDGNISNGHLWRLLGHGKIQREVEQ